MRLQYRWAVAWLVLVAAVTPSRSLGGGFELPGQAAVAAGQADAFVAQADDPSAVHYNPGGLTQMDGTQALVGLHLALPNYRFSGPSGHAQTDDPAYIPYGYVVSDLGSERWRLGLGLDSTFGLSADWGDSSPLAMQVQQVDLAAPTITPIVAYEVNEHLSVGVGPTIQYGDLELNNTLALPGGAGTGVFRFQGDDTEVGAAAGVLWKPSERHAVGVAWRSGFDMDFDGSARIYTGGPATIGPSDARASVDFPQTATIGYAFRPVSRLKLEADVQWTDWETLDQVTLQSADPRISALPPLRLEYNSSFIYDFGVEYQLTRSWVLRAGYAYNQSATPQETFTPVVADLDNHFFALGIGYHRPQRWAMDLAYRYVVSVDRPINNSINSPPGEYSDRSHSVVVSLRWWF